MKKNYIQPQSEFVVLGANTDIAVGINNTSTRESMSIDSNKKDWEDESIDWEDDYYEE